MPESDPPTPPAAPHFRVLIGFKNPSVARGLREALSELAPVIYFEAASSLAEVSEKLEAGDYRVLILDEELQEMRPGSATLGRRGQEAPDAVKRAGAWLDQGTPQKPRHAIMLTVSSWENLPCWRIGANLTAIPKNQVWNLDDSLGFLVDMIWAAEQRCALLPPTIVELDFRRTSGRCQIELRRTLSGPLEAFLGKYIFETRFPKSQIFGSFQTLSQEFSAAYLQEEPAAQSQSLTVHAHHLHAQMNETGEPQLLTNLVAVAKYAREQCCAEEQWKSYEMRPVHLHVYCDAAMLAIPLDLALPGATEYLGAELPIIWRLPGNGALLANSEKTRRRSNVIRYDRATFLVSCTVGVQVGPHYFEKLEHAQREVTAIRRVLHPLCGKRCVRHVKNRKAMATAIHGDGRPERVLHVASHAIQAAPADCAAIIVGPAGNEGGHAVTAQDLLARSLGSGDLPFEPVAFSYFNCCDLAQTAAGDASAGSHFTSFVEQAVFSGVCREVIANRWSVTDHWAARLATEFYRTKPHTASARAAALLRARRTVLHEKGGVPERDSTWLAPIHVWANC